MERIKKALDKARQQREGMAATASAERPAPETSIPSDTLAIEYTQTRRITPDPRHLREHRLISRVSAAEEDFANAYKILRTRVLRQLRQNDWNVLAVTSPGHHEGKTLTATNLAISMAREVTGTVLLVDANLERPEVHRLFGFSPEAGLSDYLTGKAAIPDILVNPDIERFVILPGRQAMSNHSEMLSSPLMSELVEELKHRYPSRTVIFDLPPVLKADDVLAFAPYVDATLLVVEDGGTNADDVRRAIGLLEDSTHFLGAILNKVEA